VAAEGSAAPTVLWSESFAEPPAARGWAVASGPSAPAASAASAPGAAASSDVAPSTAAWPEWDARHGRLAVTSPGPAGPAAAAAEVFPDGQRRFLRALPPLEQEATFEAEFVFALEEGDAAPDAALVLGVFDDGAPLAGPPLTVAVEGPQSAVVRGLDAVGPEAAVIRWDEPLQPDAPYRLTLAYDGPRKTFRARVAAADAHRPLGEFSATLLEPAPPRRWSAAGCAVPQAAEAPARSARWSVREVAVRRRAERWASPAELEHKRILGAGQYTAVGMEREDAPLPSFLAAHPEYLANHPFDGVAVPVRMEADWCAARGLASKSTYELHRLALTALPIGPADLQPALDSLQRVAWGHVTDNFLWYGVSDGTSGGDGDRPCPVAPDSAADWEIVARNAAACARLCREAGLRGLMFDTEMYTQYAGGELYPFGKGTPETWRARGEAWIRAVQSEFPAIQVLFFFSWGPEHEPGGWAGYENLKHFMNGILAGAEAPARLIHAWESTFWFGGVRNMPDGRRHVYPGDRSAFARPRYDIRRAWRAHSADPSKYDRLVEVGLAAWVESDPYNLYPGQPSGYRTELPWSNLPYALAYSDRYAWVWSQQTHYPATRGALNPFLASLANQTFNTGREEVAAFTDDFREDPLGRGWYFDFDMLRIGRDLETGFLPAMSTATVPYRWLAAERCVRVEGAWPASAAGPPPAGLDGQRRRFARPLRALAADASWDLHVDFRIAAFGADADNPLVLGLFRRDEPVARHALALRIDAPDEARLVAAVDGSPLPVVPLRLVQPLRTGVAYRARFVWDAAERRLRCAVHCTENEAPVAESASTLPADFLPRGWNEAGVAHWDDFDASQTAASRSYAYDLLGIGLAAPQ